MGSARSQLIAWLAGLGWLAGWLAGWFAGRLVGWTGWLAGWLAGLAVLAGWLAGCLGLFGLAGLAALLPALAWLGCWLDWLLAGLPVWVDQSNSDTFDMRGAWRMNALIYACVGQLIDLLLDQFLDTQAITN